MPVGELAGPGVVLCPPLTADEPYPSWHEELARRLAARRTPVIRPPAPESGDAGDDPQAPPDARLALASWVAGQAIAITASRVDRPLLLVAQGPACRGLAALGFSQRASRRRVVGYVLVDGPLPPVGPAAGDWPDAPVVCVQHADDDPATEAGARLRGWTVMHDEPVAVVSALVEHWPDLPR